MMAQVPYVKHQLSFTACRNRSLVIRLVVRLIIDGMPVRPSASPLWLTSVISMMKMLRMQLIVSDPSVRKVSPTAYVV